MSDSWATVSFQHRFAANVRRNAVALSRLCVAQFGTSYDTWRKQTTGAHRTARSANFMVLETLGQSQGIAHRRYSDGDHSNENRLGGGPGQRGTGHGDPCVTGG